MNNFAPGAVLDLSILTAMYGDDSAQTITLALSGFRREASIYMQKLHHAVQQDAHNEIARISHSLKSMCGLVGATQLMQLCQLIEQAVRQHDDAALAKLLPELAPAWQLLQAAVHAALLQHGLVDD